MRKIIPVIFILLNLIFLKGASSESWLDETGDLTDKNLSAITTSKDGETIYIGTENGVYTRTLADKSWRMIFMSKGEYKGINHIHVDNENSIYVAARNGLFKKSVSDNSWKRIFRGKGKENNCKAFSMDEGNIFLGTERGLFLSEDNTRTWKKIQGMIGNLDIKSIEIVGLPGKKDLYAICGNELYRISKDGAVVQKIFGSGLAEDQEEEPANEEEPSDESLFLLNDIAYRDNVLYLATSKGLFISKENPKAWKRLSSAGLTNRFINKILVPPEGAQKIFVATKRGVFKYKDETSVWEAIYIGMDSQDIKELIISQSNGYIFAMSHERLYKMDLADPDGSKKAPKTAESILSQFDWEPTINEVQAMAVDYAEVHPDKIRKWRRDVKFKALLPKVSFGIDNSSSETYEIYTSSSKTYWTYGPDDRTEGWDLNFSWDLSNLVWNNSQTTIDIRSKLMVQLRDDIVDEVTRIYFERRRVQTELLTHPPGTIHAKLEKDLRLQELTAGIDGLTGARFSRRLEEYKKLISE